MNGVERRRFILQGKIQSIALLFAGDIDRHASALDRSALRIAGHEASASKPANRAVLFDKAEILARCADDVFVEKRGSHL